MNFYEDIKHRLYVWNTKIGDTNFANPIDFIEAKHLEAPYKGRVFYENIINVMPNHFGAEMRNDFFKEVLQYCKQKINEIELVNTNEANKEKGYFIQHEDLMKIRKNAQYLFVENHFSNKPFIIRNQQHEVVAQVFLPLLVYIFTCEDVPYTDFDKSKKHFNGKPFQKCYIESYSKGKIDFEKDFKLSNDTLYNNSETYIRNLHDNYFHANIKGPQTWSNNEGWNYWKNENPLLINNEIIAEYGYYSAFIAGVWDLATKHPKLFETFSKCEHRKELQQTEIEKGNKAVKTIDSEPSKEKVKIIKELNAIDKNGWSYAFTSEDDFNTFVELLTNYFQQKEFKIPTETIKLKRNCKTKLAKAFNPIHINLGHDDKKLKSDIEFFDIIRVLNHFKELSNADIYDAITR